MSIRKTSFTALLLFAFLSCLSAQNTNSPYSRYGLGTLENPGFGKIRAMGGIGYGIRDNGLINPLNPASYSAVDTITMVFDMGVSYSYSQFKQGNLSQNNSNGRFDHVAMKIPFNQKWGAVLGLIPFSSVGYSYNIKGKTPIGDVDYNESYEGTGGLNTVFFGTGLSLNDNWSLGTNIKYTFGKITYAGSVVYDDSRYKNSDSYNMLYLAAPSIDLGLQYKRKLGKKGNLVLGTTFTKASNFNLGERDSINIVPGIDTTNVKKNYAFDLPTTIGIGASYTYDNRLTVGFDYQKQAWSDAAFFGRKGSLSDNTRYALGVEYLPDLNAVKFLDAVKYRFGLQYSDSYLKFSDGNIKSTGVTLGFGLPLKGGKTTLNLALEAGKLILPQSCVISENYYKISLSVSINEMWFLKSKL